MEQIIILQGLTVEQLLLKFDSVVEKRINEKLEQIKTPQKFRYLTRKDVADLLQISLPTLSDWTKLGLLKSYKIGNRVYYLSTEVDESIQSRKFRRLS